jgi:hypothetical protein
MMMMIIIFLFLCNVYTSSSSTSSIISFVAEDTGNKYGISNGDTLTITFQHPVVPSPPIGTKDDINTYFNFSAPIGSEYKGVWVTTSKAVITLIDVRNDSLPVLTYSWDFIGTVYYNATEQSIDTDKVTIDDGTGNKKSDLLEELNVGDYIRVENQPTDGIQILYLNASNMFRGGSRVVTGSPITIMDPEFFNSPRPIVKDLKYATIEKRNLIGIIPPPYRSPRFLTDINRLSIGVNYIYNSDNTVELQPWKIGAYVNETRLPIWSRKSMISTLIGTYGRPSIIKGDPGILVNDTRYNDGRKIVVNNTNNTYYTLSLSGDTVHSGCMARDSISNPTPGLSNNDTLHLYFSNHTSAPVTPMIITIDVSSYDYKKSIPDWYDASLIGSTYTFPVSATVPLNMTIPGIDMINTLCRFYVLFKLGDITVTTLNAFSILDSTLKIHTELENLHVFGRYSIASVETTYTGWKIKLNGTGCPFCRGKLDVTLVPQFYHFEKTFNGKFLYKGKKLFL